LHHPLRQAQGSASTTVTSFLTLRDRDHLCFGRDLMRPVPERSFVEPLGEAKRSRRVLPAVDRPLNSRRRDVSRRCPELVEGGSIRSEAHIRMRNTNRMRMN